MALGKEASLPSVLRLTFGTACFVESHFWTLGKVFFFLFPTKLFCMFLHYVDLHVPFWHNYKSVSITIRFSSFNWISSKNSHLNCNSLETWKSCMQKWYACYLAQVTTDFRNMPESSSTMLTKDNRELVIQLFKNCIKHKQSQKIMKLVHMSWYHI
jgi:hypothetical protein